jgi:hypothetical protein
MCRQRTKVQSSLDLPQTNYAFVKLQDFVEAEKRAKYLHQNYSIENPAFFKDVQEVVCREWEPKMLKLQ